MDLARLGKMPKQGAIAPVGPGLTQPGWPGPCRLPTSRQTNTPIMSVTVVQDPLHSCAAWLLQRLQCGPSHPLSSHPLQSTAHFTVHSRAPPLLSCTCASTWFPHSLHCSRMHDGLPSSLLWYFWVPSAPLLIASVHAAPPATVVAMNVPASGVPACVSAASASWTASASSGNSEW
jgi:hypothetical protein